MPPTSSVSRLHPILTQCRGRGGGEQATDRQQGHPLEGTLSRDNSPPQQKSLDFLQGNTHNANAPSVPFVRTRFFSYLWLQIISDLFQSPIGIRSHYRLRVLRPRKSSVPYRVQMCISAPVVINQPLSGSRHGQIRFARGTRRSFCEGGKAFQSALPVTDQPRYRFRSPAKQFLLVIDNLIP